LQREDAARRFRPGPPSTPLEYTLAVYNLHFIKVHADSAYLKRVQT